MYATVQIAQDILARAGVLGSGAAERAGPEPGGALVDQVCAEAGVWAPDAAVRALDQAGGDLCRAVSLLRVWAATLPYLRLEPVRPVDVCLLRRLSAAYADVPGGQWLGPTTEFGSRLLRWDDDRDPTDRDPTDRDPTDRDAPASTHQDRPDHDAAPTRAAVPRVRDLLADVPLLPVPEEGPGPDPTRAPLTTPVPRGARLAAFARAETGALVAMSQLALLARREAVVAELVRAAVTVRRAHPRTGRPCRVADVSIVEAEVVIDCDVDGRPGFALGWAVSMGTLERRVVAAAVLDGTLQEGASAGLPGEPALLGAVDGIATAGFVEHLRLPHYASFASYLARVGKPPHPDGGEPADRDGEAPAQEAPGGQVR